MPSPKDADFWFKQGIVQLPSDAASCFLIPFSLEARLGRQNLLLANQRLIGEFWDRVDPTPLTVLNEYLLQCWYNLSLAAIFFGDPKKGIRGWDTAPGKAVAVFGPPSEWSFDHGRFGDGEAKDAPRLDPSFYLSALPFEPPMITMSYPTGLSLAFVDPTLQGDWVAADRATGSLLEEMMEQGPPVALPIQPGEIARIYVSHVSSRHEEDESQEGCIVCIPPWDRDRDWWKGTVVTLSIFDSQVQEVVKIDHLVDELDLHEIEPGRKAILFGKDFRVAPGSYNLRVGIDQNGGERTGARSYPIRVERFDVESLQLSDIEPACPGTFRQDETVLHSPPRPYLPDPTATVHDSGELDVAYTVYNLTPDQQGTARYEVRYVIVPLEYRREYGKLLAAGSPTAEDSLRFGRLGDRLGEIVLSEENRQEVQFFPVEIRNVRTSGAVRKMATLHLADKPDGLYALRITVTDKVSGRTAQAEVPFRKVPISERERMLSGGRR